MANCSQAGCSSPSYARGLCTRHYKHAQYRGTIEQYPLSHCNDPTPLRCECAMPEPQPVSAFGVTFLDVFECARCRRAALDLSKANHPSSRS